MRQTLMLGMVCAGLSCGGPSRTVLAEGQNVSPDLGDPYYLYSAKTYGDHAADHVHILRQFISRGSPLSTDRLRQHVGAVRENAVSTQWAYSQLSAAVKNQPDDQQELAEIEQHYAQVLEICDRLDAACAETTVDAGDVSRVLDQLQSSLSAARVGHQELAIVWGGQR
jgi:hypothetical protein